MFNFFHKYESITCKDLKQLLEAKKISLLDVREKDEYKCGHIKGAQSIPLSKMDREFNKLSKNETYYILCHSGIRSASACSFLERQGYKVINVKGGMAAWSGPVE